MMSPRRLLPRIPVHMIYLIVMRGLDPRIHHLRKIYAKRVDPRVKPAGDGSGWTSSESIDRKPQFFSKSRSLPHFNSRFASAIVAL